MSSVPQNPEEPDVTTTTQPKGRRKAAESKPATAPVEPEGSGVYFADVYSKLAAPFDSTHSRVQAGVSLEYITGEQCVSRLNEVLGVAGWSFCIKEHGINAEADEAWCLGEVTANFGGTIVVRQQFGSNKIKRSRSSGNPMDIGFDLKGAATDALKKCASLLGVGLYLSSKEDHKPAQAEDDEYGPSQTSQPRQQGNGQRRNPAPQQPNGKKLEGWELVNDLVKRINRAGDLEALKRLKQEADQHRSAGLLNEAQYEEIKKQGKRRETQI